MNALHVNAQHFPSLELFVTTRANVVPYIVMRAFHVVDKVFVLLVLTDIFKTFSTEFTGFCRRLMNTHDRLVIVGAV